ncbi:MAG: hypothetical protein EOP46_01525 [Sphingobacteriaceae bacterium]|nr:MAG: hypothetical protein EOP46_01525 [Sphingobacteriaceae bacterium]
MKKVDKLKLDTPEKEIQKATEVLHDIVLDYKAKYCRVNIDGEIITGNFLLAEVMNIRSVGPNLVLAPDANPGDGMLEVVLIPEDQRRQFADYLTHIINGNSCPPFNYQTYSGKNISIEWDDTLLHADDELVELQEKAAISIEIQHSAMKFLVP